MFNDLLHDPLLIIPPLLGVLLLAWGRKLLWFLVGCAGFLLATHLCNEYLIDQPLWIRLSISIVVGLIGIILAVVIQRVAFAIAGFQAGATSTVLLMANLGAAGDERVYYIIGGLVGALLAILLMDHVIIVLACIIGASAIVGVLPFSTMTIGIIFLVLVLCGCFYQFQQLRPSSED